MDGKHLDLLQRLWTPTGTWTPKVHNSTNWNGCVMDREVRDHEPTADGVLHRVRHTHLGRLAERLSQALLRRRWRAHRSSCSRFGGSTSEKTGGGQMLSSP